MLFSRILLFPIVFISVGINCRKAALTSSTTLLFHWPPHYSDRLPHTSTVLCHSTRNFDAPLTARMRSSLMWRAREKSKRERERGGRARYRFRQMKALNVRARSRSWHRYTASSKANSSIWLRETRIYRNVRIVSITGDYSTSNHSFSSTHVNLTRFRIKIYNV